MTKELEPQNIPVFILCGGLGTRLREQTQHIPKPMVRIGEKPMLLHIMRWYSKYGFRKFILCMGYKSEVIQNYFQSFYALNSDYTLLLRNNSMKVNNVRHDYDWEVTLAYTGLSTMTGARVYLAAKRYLTDEPCFAVTYGDGVTDFDLSFELKSHFKLQKIATVLGINPPSRFGEFIFKNEEVVGFTEKPRFNNTWINGGYFIFNREFLSYLSDDDSCVLETEPLSQLASDRQVNLLKHHGFWACMDTQRDVDYLQGLWEAGNAPWAV